VRSPELPDLPPDEGTTGRSEIRPQVGHQGLRESLSVRTSGFGKRSVKR